VLGALALLPALYLLEAYTFHRRETLGRQALRVSAAFGVVGVVVLLATLIFGRPSSTSPCWPAGAPAWPSPPPRCTWPGGARSITAVAKAA
jgi:hypothetical protein